MELLKPAIALMNRLRYPQKFALISALFLVPLVLVVGLLFAEINDRVAFAQKEQVGTAYLRSLLAFSQSVQENRRQVELDKTPNLEETAARFQTLAATDRRYGGTLEVHDLFLALASAWQQGDYPRLGDAVHRLRVQVGDCSNLILDPDLDSYYLMDASLLKLPDIRRLLFTLGAQLRQGDTSVAKPLTQLAGLREDLLENLANGFRHNPKGNLAPALQPALRHFSETLAALNAVPLPDLEGTVFGALQESWQLWQQITDQLDGLLGDRIWKYQQRQLGVTVCIGGVLLAVVYLFAGFYQSVMATVGQLDQAASAMARGETVELTLANQDELGQVVGAFNRIAKAVLAAEAKFRSIFENSVDGIFQTTPSGRYLSANPALARMYGYESPAELIQSLTDIGTQLYVEGDRRELFQRQLQESGQITDFESEVYRRDGSRLWIRENARAVTSAGEIAYYEGTVSDITARKAAEQALAQATAEIQSLNERLSEENLRMKGELVVARKLQQMILPKEAELREIRDLDVAGFMQPADEVGGDYYDVLQAGGRVKIGIGDVTGHGLESGMMMLMVQMAVRTLLVSQENDPIRFLNALNQAVYSNVQRMNTDKNLTLTLVDYEDGQMTLSGQHEAIVLVRANGTLECIDTEALGFPIGLEEKIEGFLDKLILYLQPNDVVVLYTDGITEAESPSKELYGLPRLCEVLQRHHHKAAAEICQAVIQDVREHIQDQKVHDDITLLVLKQK